MINSIEEWQKLLQDGVVFDWHLAADLLRGFGGCTAYAATSGALTVIWKDGKPAPQDPFPFAGNACIELRIGEEIWNCFTSKAEHPDWNENTYWPESARARLNISK